MALTAAERQRKRRQKLKNTGQYSKYKELHREHVRNYRQRQKEEFLKESEHKKKQILFERREKDRLRQAKFRRNKEKDAPSISPGFSAKYSLNRAVNKLKVRLPLGKKKKSEVIRKLVNDFNVEIDELKKPERSDKVSDLTTHAVKKFYHRDDISRICPGRRDTITVRNKENHSKEKLQKRHLVLSIKETYAVFKEENSNLKIGLSKFAEFRPPDVLLSSQTPTNVCQCIYHQNFILALNALHNYVPEIPNYSKDFIGGCLQEPENEECWFSTCSHLPTECGFNSFYEAKLENYSLNDETKWFIWKEENGRVIKFPMTGTLQDLFDHVCNIAPKFFKHCFIKRKQSLSYEADKDDAKKEDSKVAVLQMDFAENFKCTAQDEVQSAHWNQAQVTIFTSCTWFRDKIIPHIVISDVLIHDKNTSIIFTDEILSKVCGPEVEEVRIWTDGPSSQFKNRFVMAALDLLQKKHGVKISWNFSATSHGKGPVDGIGATVKRIAVEQVKTRKSVINNSSHFFATVQKSSVGTSLINSSELQSKLEEMNLKQIFDLASPIPGISGFHYINFTNGSYITKNYSSQFNNIVNNTQNDLSLNENDNEVDQIKVNAIIAIKFVGKCAQIYYIYMAQVLDIDGDDILLRYLQRVGDNLYSWPTEPEESWQSKDDVICNISQPNLANNRGQMTFSVESVAKISQIVEGMNIVPRFK